ncbi:MAG: M15 family metallopeptidase [Hyphomicrobium sp.]
MRIILLSAFVLFTLNAATAGELTDKQRARLLAAYPDHLERIEDGVLIWRDGTHMAPDDGKGEKAFRDWLNAPDIEDTLAQPYPLGEAPPPAKDVDPGRARNEAFFNKVYGDCRKGEVAKNLVSVVWLPNKTGQRLAFNKVNGAAAALEAVSRELDQLPARFDTYLFPSGGTYNCRVIAGTNRLSAHNHAIAIDIALRHTDYWRNAKPRADGAYAYKNKIPMEIVRIFEKHDFIWGGKWHHYDTMHFEYRPELLGNDR